MLNKEDLLKLMGVRGERPTPDQEAKAEYTLALSNLRALLLEARRLPGTETAAKTADDAIVAAEKLAAGAKKADFDAAKKALAASTEAMPEAIERGRVLLEKQNQQEEVRHLKERKELRAREPYQAELVV